MTSGDGDDDGLRRSVALLRAFAVEQSEPARFYGALASDSVRTVLRYAPLAGAVVLDVGAGPGEFARAFVGAGGPGRTVAGRGPGGARAGGSW